MKKVSFSKCHGTQQGAKNKLINKKLEIWKTFLQKAISSNNLSVKKKKSKNQNPRPRRHSHFPSESVLAQKKYM